MNIHPVPRSIALLTGLLLVGVVCLATIMLANIFPLLLGFIALLLFFLVTRPDVTVILICWLFFTSIRIPGLPGGRQLYEPLMILFFALSIARQSFSPTPGRFSFPRVCTWLFLFVLILTMAIRGIGFESLGGSMWGGGRYMVLIPPALFFISASSINLSSKQWRIAITGLVVLGLIPGFAELTYKISHGAIAWPYHVLKPTRALLWAMEQDSVESILRFEGFIFGSYFFLFPFLRYPPSQQYTFLYLVCIMIGAFFVGLTGHRLNLVIFVLFLWTFFFLKSKTRFRYALVFLFLACTCAFILGQLAPHFPRAVQRVLTIIPGAKVPYDVYLDAMGTTTWRIKVWREAIKEVPRYLLLGKGYAYYADAFFYAVRGVHKSEYQHLLWALVTTAYHQGILSLLIGLGAPGLLAGIGFLFSICLRHYRLTLEHWSDADLQRQHYTLFVITLVSAFVYLFVYGDVFRSFPIIFFFAALLEGLGRSKKDADLQNQPVSEA